MLSKVWRHRGWCSCLQHLVCTHRLLSDHWTCFWCLPDRVLLLSQSPFFLFIHFYFYFSSGLRTAFKSFLHFFFRLSAQKHPGSHRGFFYWISTHSSLLITFLSFYIGHVYIYILLLFYSIKQFFLLFRFFLSHFRPLCIVLFFSVLTLVSKKAAYTKQWFFFSCSPFVLRIALCSFPLFRWRRECCEVLSFAFSSRTAKKLCCARVRLTTNSSLHLLIITVSEGGPEGKA